jgi:hypothetical protein
LINSIWNFNEFGISNNRICDFFLFNPCIKHVSHTVKVIPLQALTGPEGSRRLRLSDFKTIGTWRWQGCQP